MNSEEDIIRMAREAGGCEYGNANPEIESTFILKDDQIKAFATLVAAAEREACAAMFDNHNVWDEEVGERIRARGQA
jgi:hypothetical protein